MIIYVGWYGIVWSYDIITYTYSLVIYNLTSLLF